MSDLETKTKQDLIERIKTLEYKIDRALEKCCTGIRKQGGDYYLESIEEILKGDEH